jgi:hypothetical protein
VDQKKWRTGRLSEEQNSDIYDGFYFISVHALGLSLRREVKRNCTKQKQALLKLYKQASSNSSHYSSNQTLIQST